MQTAVDFPDFFEPSPTATTEPLKINRDHFLVVRDDLLPGGTKQRGLGGLLLTLKKNNLDRVAYASPFCGYAQVALAYLSQKLGMECFLFCERDRSSLQPGPHPYTKRARDFGAHVFLYDSLAEAHHAAQDFAAFDSHCKQIPLGFDCPEFYAHYVQNLTKQWAHLVAKLGREPRHLWLPVGSGTLAWSFLQVLHGTETRIQALDVHVLKPNDPRLTRLRDSPRLKLWSAPWKFHVPEPSALSLPSNAFPSNAFYDAKIRPFLVKYGMSGDIWWNVAG